MSFRRGFKAEAERIAIEVRSRIGLDAIDRLDVDQLCRYFDIPVIPMTSLPCDCSLFQGLTNGSFSAVTIPCGLRTAIVHNDTHGAYRQRSNICHELAHCFLGHKACPPLDEKGERIHDQGMEAEANFLGGALLLPHEAAMHVLMNKLGSSAQRLYGISKPMLEYRLRASGAEAHYRNKVRKLELAS